MTCGEDQEFEITPNQGYDIADVAVNGNSIGAETSYMFSDVRSDGKRIHAAFIDDNETTELKDAILALKVLVGMNPSEIRTDTDVNEDEKIGMEEVIYALQIVADMKEF
ncbi:hypothetical protein QUF80_04725 [Desulfococcaceae bacterium HSG8]|nr:hypothetical protein [Desulfococcaceae bacterium HSG8]